MIQSDEICSRSYLIYVARDDVRKIDLKEKARLRKEDQELGAVARSRKLTKEMISNAAQNGQIVVDLVPVETKEQRAARLEQERRLRAGEEEKKRRTGDED